MAGVEQDAGEGVRRQIERRLCDELCKAPGRQDQELIDQCQLALSRLGQVQTPSGADIFNESTASDWGELDLARMERLRTNGWWRAGRDTRSGVFQAFGKVAAVSLAVIIAGAAARVGNSPVAGDVIFRVVQEWEDGLITTQRIPNTDAPVAFEGAERYLEDPTGTLALPNPLPEGCSYEGEIVTTELGWGYMVSVSYLLAEGDLIVISVGIPKSNDSVVFGVETGSEYTERFTVNGIEFMFCEDLGLNKCQWRVGANEYMLQSAAPVETIKEFLTHFEAS